MDDKRDRVQEAVPRLLPGTVVDHFRVLRLLGRGGMSEVHLARDTRLGRKVALKLIIGDQASSPRLKRLFRAEAQATASFNHPNIVTIFHVGDHDGSPYLALEYLEGETLAQRTRKEQLGTMGIVRIAWEIAQALREAHSHGILHRDLKPENVVITTRGRTKVLDFGLAIATQDAIEESAEPEDPDAVAERMARHITERTMVASSDGATGMEIQGTPLFMAPEQWRRQESTAAVDIWSLGMILYLATTGRKPYLVSTMAELVTAVTGPAPVPLKPVEEAAPSLRDLIRRCLEKDPTDRPSAEELVVELERMLGGGQRTLPADTCPFRGLLPFTEEHADLFYGRGPEVTAFVERLRARPILAVVGPSGAGKSSFVRAGVIPRLREQGKWLTLVLRPGTTPFEHLASALLAAETGTDRETASGTTSRVGASVLADEIGKTPGLLGLRLQQLADRDGSKILLVVDQLEELYTLIPDEQVRRRYMQAVCQAADDADGAVRVVFTLRDDSLGRVAEEPVAQEALSHVTLLRRPGRDALNEILIRPLEAVAYRYDDPGLVEEMLSEVRGESACLPLLQFVTRMLWDRRDAAGRFLLRSVYESMGGVGGALAEQADAVITSMSPSQEALARQVLLRLVTPEGTRRVRAHADLLDGLQPEAEQVLNLLVEGRLVTVMRGKGVELPEAEVELVHESLIRVWGRLARWINETYEELAFLAELRQAAELWVRRGEREHEVWQGEALHEVSRWMARSSTAIPEVVSHFHRAGLALEQRQRKSVRARRVAVTATLAVVAMVSLVAAWAYSTKERQAERARDRAVVQRAEAQREGARAALGRSALIEASALLRATLEARDSAHARALWRRLKHHPLAWKRTVGAYVYAVSFSPDGKQLAVACQDHSIYLFDTRTQQVRFLRGHTDQILSMAFSPGGDRIASATWSGEIYLWHLPGERHTVLPKHGGAVWRLRFTPDGGRLVTASFDGKVRIFDVGGPPPAGAKRPTLLRALEGKRFMGLAISRDGKLVAGGDRGGVIRIWHVESGSEYARLEGHDDIVAGLDFSPDGRRLVSASHDRTVRIWDVRNRSLVKVLCRINATFNSLRYSPDGAWIAAGANEGTIHLWRTGTRWRRYRLKGHTATVYALSFSPDSRLLGTGSTDKTVRVWRLAEQALDAELPHGHTALIYGVAFSPDGRWIASGGRDRKILLWDVATGQPDRVLSASSPVFGIDFSPDGKQLASALAEGQVQLWDVASGAATATTLSGHRELTAVTFSPDGKALAAGCHDGRVRVWDVASGRLRWKARHEGAVFGVSFNAGGDLLASASFDQTVRLWEPTSGAPRGVLRHHKAGVFGVAFANDGRLTSGSADGTVRLWTRDRGSSRVLGRLPARIYNIALSRDDTTVGAPSADHTARLWSLTRSSLKGDEVVLRGHRGEVNFLAFSPDGQKVATTSDDETVRVWDARNGRPFWRSPVILKAPPRLLTHRGWLDLERNSVAQAPEGAWARVVEQRARKTAVHRSVLCLANEEQALEVWDRSADRRLSTHQMPGLRDVAALPSGCLVLQRTKALLVPRSGAPRELSAQASAVSWDRETILVATPSQTLVFDASGTKTAAFGGRPGVQALAHVGDWLALGNNDGNIELVAGPGSKGRRAPRVYFEDVPSSPVVRLLEGPRETLFVGFANGTVGLWSTSDGTRLEKRKLHGPIRHMVRTDTRLHVATELGDHASVDLQDYLQRYCPLLRQVWSHVPVVWEGGQVRLQPPPAGHRCARANPKRR